MGKQKKILPSDDASIDLAIAAIKNGGLIGLPTETVYGLAGNALDDRAILKIYQVKNRPSYNPLIVHVADINMARAVAHIPPDALKLMQAFWPGPLTLVLKRRSDCPLSPLLSAGLNSVALRAPQHPVAHELLKRSKLPLAAPSANISGSISPTTAQHVLDGLADHVDYIIDGGAAEVGVESTIVALLDDNITLLRPGSISQRMIENCLGQSINIKSSNKNTPITAPGQMESHYAPEHPLHLNVIEAGTHEFMIGFGAIQGDINLSPTGDLNEAAHNLFAMLRLADQSTKKAISIAPIPMKNIGIAMNDRLMRAAAPKGDDE